MYISLIESPPTHSPTKIVRWLKGISSKKLREEFLPQLKQHIWKEGTLWATGYYVASVSDGATSDVVAEYIRTQRERQYKIPNDFEKLSSYSLQKGNR